MRTLVAILFLVAGQTSFAAQETQPSTMDTKIGPVVGIKREILGVYNNCLANMIGDVTKPMFSFSCLVSFNWDSKSEAIMNINPLVRHAEETCMVEVNFAKERLILFFGNPKGPLTFDEAKLCLQKGTATFGNKIELLIFKADAGPSIR